MNKVSIRSHNTHESKATALVRNKYICEMADHIVFAGVTARSSLWAFKVEYKNKQLLINQDHVHINGIKS